MAVKTEKDKWNRTVIIIIIIIIFIIIIKVTVHFLNLALLSEVHGKRNRKNIFIFIIIIIILVKVTGHFLNYFEPSV